MPTPCRRYSYLGVNLPHSSHAIPSCLPSNKGGTQWSTRPGFYHHTTVTPKTPILSARVHHTTRFLLSTLSVNGMFSSRTCGKAYMVAWSVMATRVAPSGSRPNLLWRCALMAGLINTLLGGGSAQVTSSMSSLSSLSTTATPTVNALTASATYSPTNSWAPTATCSAGSSAVGGYGGGVYLDGYGTYWSVACGYDWSGTTFYDGAGYAYVSWRASWSLVAVLTCAALWALPAEAYTTASEDARPGLAASPSPTLAPSTPQLPLPKVRAGVSKLAWHWLSLT